MTFRRVKRGRYWSYELDGERMPGRSVTGFIYDGLPKPNLIDWSAKIAAEFAADNIDRISTLERGAAVDMVKLAHKRVTSTAALKGQVLHGYAERLSRGEPIEVPPELAGYVDAFVHWLEDWQPEPLAIEAAVANRKWRYVGSTDLIARMPTLGELLALIDVKTGGSGVWPETCLQIAAYRAAEVMLDPEGREAPMLQTQAGYALWLGDDGSYEFLPLECGEDVFRVFLHVTKVAEFMRREKDELIGLALAAPAEEVPA